MPGFGGGVSPVSQQGSITKGGVAVWLDQGILVDGSTVGLVTEAPEDGQTYGRQNGLWIPITGGGGGLTSITAGTGLSGGTITSSGTIALQTPVSLANGGTGVSVASAAGLLTALGGAPLNSAALTGTPTLVTPPASTDDSNALATTAWVTSKVASATAGVSQITATTPISASASTGAVTLSLGTVPINLGGTGATTAAAGLLALGGAPLVSPPLTGTPTAPTATAGTNTTQIATTAFVETALSGISALPTGGAIYDVLSKASATDGDVAWRGAGVRSNNNTALGPNAFNLSATGPGNVAIGSNTLAAITTGGNNIAIGSGAASAVNAFNNIAIGANAFSQAITGGNNVYIGLNAGQTVTGGGTNIALGFMALYRGAPNANIAVGAGALSEITGVSAENIAIGSGAGKGITSGDQNIAIGDSAALFPSGNMSGSIFIGKGACQNAAGETNQIAIGMDTTGRGSNTITLGNTDVTALYTRAGLVLGNPADGALGQGTINSSNRIQINPSGVVPPTDVFTPLTWLRVINPSGEGAYATFDTFVNINASSTLYFRRARGTPDAPLPLVSGQALGSFEFRGWDGIGFTQPSVRIEASSVDAFSTTTRGGILSIRTTLPGAGSLDVRSTVRFGNGISLGNPGDADNAFQGLGTINVPNGYYIAGQRTGFAQTAGWVAGTDPSGAILYSNNTGRTLTIISIVGQREVANTTPAEIDVYTAASNVPIAGGTKVTVVDSFDAGDVAPEQTVNLTSGTMLLAPGERLGLVVAMGAVFDDSVASISVYLA